MREYKDNFDYIDELIQDLQCRHSSVVEHRTVNAGVAGSTPAAGEARREREERQYFAIVDARLYDHCKLDN